MHFLALPLILKILGKTNRKQKADFSPQGLVISHWRIYCLPTESTALSRGLKHRSKHA